MSKDRLLSDNGLRAEIANILLLDRQTVEPYVSVVDDLINLVNTQKRLYAESVIGANQPMPKRGDTDPDIYVEVIHRVEGRNALRAEQRRRIK